MKILFTLLLLCNLLVGCGYQRGVIESDDTYVFDAIVLREGENPWDIPFTANPETHAFIRIQVENKEVQRTESELALYIDTADGQSKTIFRDYYIHSGTTDRSQLSKGHRIYISVKVPFGRTTIRLIEGRTNQICEFQLDAGKTDHESIIVFTLADEQVTASTRK